MLNSVVIVQPPLVQLNGPYPSGAYLSAFFRDFAPAGRPSFVRWIDGSNELFLSLFSRAGMEKIFSLSRLEALSLADRNERNGDAESAFQLRRYVSRERDWVSWIDGIVSILRTGDRELSHAFVRSPSVPRGARMDAFLAELGGEPSADDARMLATLALEDIADFVTVAFDGEFSLVRYAESLAMGKRNFAEVESGLGRPLVEHFVEPLFERLWDGISEEIPSDGNILFCLSVPFPGCLVNSLAVGRSIKSRWGDRAVVLMGGGYVSTELRGAVNERLFSYVDALSFDRGYGCLAELLSSFSSSSGRRPEVQRRLLCSPDMASFEREVTERLVPDYGDIDFSRYPRLADDPNPMHRLWSDGTWLKAYLAHGCYWHRCSFCDVGLDYVRSYVPVRVPSLYAGLREQALRKNVRGFHLVDEAAPPRALRDFAHENLWASRRASSEGGVVPFWGNIRFEKAFTRDLADFLSSGGLVAVSGGIEIASPEGFASVDKGIDLASLVSVCAAFKEAGILVHAYLIYGYWNEDAQGVVDAAETMRQLFAAGLVDSAFWHKFVLTRHSRVYREWQGGMHRESACGGLRPIDEEGDFANNDLRFEGERAAEKYTAGLDSALAAWMAGEGLDLPIRSWFAFPLPDPSIAPNVVDSCVAAYEAFRDGARDAPCDSGASYYWAGSEPLPVREAGGTSLLWFYLGDEIRMPVDAPIAKKIVAALRRADGPVLADTAALSRLPAKIFRHLRRHGLVKISLP